MISTRAHSIGLRRCLAGGLAAACLLAAGAAALAAGTWSPPERIPQYANEARPPVLVADRNRTVYAFNNQPYDLSARADQISQEAVFVRQWSLNRGWSAPADILLSPFEGPPAVLDAHIDASGTIHLIYFGGHAVEGAVLYSRAPASEADLASSWIEPMVIGEDAGPLAFASIAGDDNGNLYVAYEGKGEGNGLYAVHSSDSGNTWSNPVTLFLTYSNKLWAYDTELYVDPQGRVYAMWAVANESGNGDGVYFARLDAQTRQWTAPKLMAARDDGDYSTHSPTIIRSGDALLAVYQDGSPATRWMTQSLDDGETWSEPIRPFPHVGEYGRAVMLYDSRNILHMVLGNRNGECCHGMWHSTWDGNRWSELEPIVTGPKTPSFDPSLPAAVVSQGNVILAAWWTDTGGLPRNGSWYSYAELDAPELPVVTPAPLAPTVEAGAPPATPAGRPPASPTPRPALPDALKADAVRDSPAEPINLGAIAVVSLAAVVLLFQYIRSRIR
jgi:hypothetical protein